MKLIKIPRAGLLVGALLLSILGAQPISARGLAPTNIAPSGEFTNIVKAQFKLPFGMTAEKVRRQLRQDGFDEIEVTHLGILDAKADACLRGTRYRLKLRVDGSYEYRNEIGKCRPVIAARDVDDILKKQGFTEIDVSDSTRVPYIVSGCRNGARYEIEVDEFGEVKVRNKVAECTRDMLSPRDVRRALRKDGFDRVTFTDRTPPRFTIEACRGDTKLRLVIDRRGKIADRQRIGRCSPEIQGNQIASILEQAGYDRIDVVDDKPPRFRAEACRGNDRIRIALSPWGERIRENKIGECTPPATIASLTEELQKNPKLKAVRVREGKRYPFVANVCIEGKKMELLFSRYGKLEGNRDEGRCESPRLDAVHERLAKDGLQNIQTFIEACSRRGRKVRVRIDEYGAETERATIGRCN